MRKWATPSVLPATPVEARERVQDETFIVHSDAHLLEQVIRSVEAIRERHKGKAALAAISLLEMLNELEDAMRWGNASEQIKAWRSEHSDDAWKLLKTCLIESGQIKVLEGDELVEQFTTEFAGEIKERK